MDYALVLYFDKETESYFNGIIDSIASSGVSNYMVENNVVPHITIAAFYTEDIGSVVPVIDNNISHFVAGNVVWASIGSFVPRVLFAAPVMNEYLLNACVNMNRLVKPLAHCSYDHYLPYQWVPHTTLASNLESDSLRGAFNIAMQKFSAIAGKCVKLSLIQCNPIKEVKAWDLV